MANDFGNNVLLRNRGDGTFEDLSEASGIGGYSTSMGVTTGDLSSTGPWPIAPLAGNRSRSRSRRGLVGARQERWRNVRRMRRRQVILEVVGSRRPP